MPPKSAVELSPNRTKVDKLLKEGKSSRFISNYLKTLKKNPETISHTAINTYKKNKFNIHKEASIKYHEKKSKEMLDEAVDKTVSDLEYCDNIVSLANEVNLKVDHENKITELDIKKLGLQAIKTKHEITKDEPDNVINLNLGVENNVIIPKDPGLRARGREFIQSIRAGQNESSDSSHGDK